MIDVLRGGSLMQW